MFRDGNLVTFILTFILPLYEQCMRNDPFLPRRNQAPIGQFQILTWRQGTKTKEIVCPFLNLMMVYYDMLEFRYIETYPPTRSSANSKQFIPKQIKNQKSIYTYY